MDNIRLQTCRASGRQSPGAGYLRTPLLLVQAQQRHKARQQHFEATGSLPGDTVQVTVTERKTEAQLIKCRCLTAADPSMEVFVFCHRRSLPVANGAGGCYIEVGDSITLHQPWHEVDVPGRSLRMLLCPFLSCQDLSEQRQ